MARSIDFHKPDCSCRAHANGKGTTGPSPHLSVRLDTEVFMWLKKIPGGPRQWIEDQVRSAVFAKARQVGVHRGK